MRLLRPALLSLIVVACVAFGVREVLRIDAIRRPLMTYLHSSPLTIHPEPPWYYEYDYALAQKVKEVAGMTLASLWQCDWDTCGFRGRFAIMSFPLRRPDFGVMANADALGRMLNEADYRIPSQANYQATTVSAINSLTEVAYIAVQIDRPDQDATLKEYSDSVVRWANNWLECRKNGTCPWGDLGFGNPPTLSALEAPSGGVYRPVSLTAAASSLQATR